MLIWTKGGELTGDDDLKGRFQQAWEAADQEKFRLSLDKQVRAHFRAHLAADILRRMCPETLGLQWAQVSMPGELEQTAQAWNARQKGSSYTAEDVRWVEEENIRLAHCGPPYSWEEVEETLSEQTQPGKDEAPSDIPKCLECLEPMEWLWFSSPSDTWEMECGRAGWTPVCRACRTWRACRIVIMN